jgi:hypothetical protein
MEIKASHLKRGVEVDNACKYTLLYKHGDPRPYQICKYATKEAFYTYSTLTQAVTSLNRLTGYDDVAIEDSEEGGN